MTDLQKVEFDLLKQFVEICDKLSLPYFLVCGSALGAVKYQGFIPWDDDVDVALKREDYERFLTEAPALLPEHLFLQNYRTDAACPQFYTKLRDSGTTYIEKSAAKLPIHHGVYIDVFPLDGYPARPREKRRLERRKRRYQLQLSCAYAFPGSKKAALFLGLERMLGFHKRTRKIAGRLDNLLAAYPTEQSELLCNHGNWQGKLEYAPRWQYGEGAWATFEGLKVRIPEAYDAYLTQKYGDWRADLPEEQKVGHHTYERIDLTRPYTAFR